METPLFVSGMLRHDLLEQADVLATHGTFRACEILTEWATKTRIKSFCKVALLGAMSYTVNAGKHKSLEVNVEITLFCLG